MKSITVSAPGKLMLFGEHAVVYGKPCLVTAVSQRLSLKAELLKTEDFILEAPDVDITNYKKPLSQLGEGEIPKGAKFVEFALKNFLVKHKILGGVKFETVSQFKATFGFGSSSASAVCAVSALSKLFDIRLEEKEFFDIAYKTVLDVQGLGSGFDLAAAIYGGTLLYVTGGKIIKPVEIKSLPLIVGYTGIKADTVTLVKQVKEKINKYPDIFGSMFDVIEEIVLNAKIALEKGDLQAVGELMNINQGFLEGMEVGSQELANLIYAARNAGAYGAKLSGAGGGDCMIALAPPSKIKDVKEAITKAGGQVLDVTVNTEGVRIE